MELHMLSVHSECIDKVRQLSPNVSCTDPIKKMSSYAAIEPTLLPKIPTLLGQLKRKAENAASSSSVNKIYGRDDFECVVVQLDKSFAIDKSL